MKLLSLINYHLTIARRDLIFISLIITILLLTIIALFFGNTSLTEQGETVLVYMASSVRIVVVLGSILFISFYIKRAFDNKEIEFILSKAISRSEFLLSLFLTFFLIVIIIVLFIGLLILTIFKVEQLNLLIWAMSLILESWVIVSFAIFISIITNNILISHFATIGFYALSRLLGFLFLLINNANLLSKEFILKIIALAIPRIDLFTQTEWLVYGINDFKILYLIISQGLVYISFIYFLTLVEFRRKGL